MGTILCTLSLTEEAIKDGYQSGGPCNKSARFQRSVTLFFNLKALLTRFVEVYTCLEHNINSFGIFHHENYDILRQRVEELHNQLAPKSKTLSKTKDINCYELENILKAVIELRKDSEKLQWYYRVNKEAVQRIYAKLEKLCRSTGHTDEGHKVKWTDLEADRDVSWLKYTGSLNELMTAII